MIRRLRNDESLASLVRAGDEKAFDVLARRYRAAMTHYARKLLKRTDLDAQPVVAGALDEARASLRPRGRRTMSVGPLLLSLTRDHAIDALRQVRAAGPAVAEPEPVIEPEPAQPKRTREKKSPDPEPEIETEAVPELETAAEEEPKTKPEKSKRRRGKKKPAEPEPETAVAETAAEVAPDDEEPAAAEEPPTADEEPTAVTAAGGDDQADEAPADQNADDDT